MPRGSSGWSAKTLKGCFLAETLEGRCLKTGKAFQGEECKGPVVGELQKCLRSGKQLWSSGLGGVGRKGESQSGGKWPGPSIEKAR